MAFMIFRKERDRTGMHFSNAHQDYKLAGYNLLYKLWGKKNEPVGCGWSVTAEELLKEHDAAFNGRDHALVIDFHPTSRTRIGLVEIEAIHIYTYGESSDEVYWSPMMLELRDVYYKQDFAEPLTPSLKHDILARLELAQTREKIVEFLYLQTGWNWGRTGNTNAAFIYDDARRYFQRVFGTHDAK
jgi:hypothetical protein